ncbi:proline-rich protein 5-like isoform X1 [Amblyomma americanum]
MSQLLRKSFKSHRRAHSTPPVSLVTATDKNPRNTLPTVKATLTEVPEHEELRSGGTRHGSLDFNAPMSVVPRSVDEAKIGLAKYSTQTSARVSLPKNRDWLRLQQTIRNLFKTKNVPLEPGEMAVLHEKIRTLISSKAGPFLFDSFKREIEVCFAALLQRLQEVPRENLLQVLSSEWENLFRHILPTLDMILYVVKGKGSISVRQAFLVAFRDIVVTKLDLEDLLNTDAGYVVPDGIRHMLLILYNVSDSYPPTKTKLKLEGMLARILNPFLGFQGLYEGTPEPTVKSAEPEVASRRKSADGVPLPRKLSRPMSSQPRQIETLHELFLTALRKQPDF